MFKLFMLLCEAPLHQTNDADFRRHHLVRRAVLRATTTTVAAAPAASFLPRFALSAASPAVCSAIRQFTSSTARCNEPVSSQSAEEQEVENALKSVLQTSSESNISNASHFSTASGPATTNQQDSQSSPAKQYEDGDFLPEANGVYGCFVYNIPFRCSERELFDTFSRFGKLHSLNIGRDARGLSRGFAFIYYSTLAEAKNAVNTANEAFWQGRRIGCKPKNPGASGPKTVNTTRPPTPPTRSLYVGNIPYEATDAELAGVFSSLEGVLDVRVAIDKATGWPRGFAHADFTTIEAATKAMEKISTVSIQGRLLRVDYSEAKQLGDSTGFKETAGPNDKVL